MSQPDDIRPICSEQIMAGLPVIFDRGQMLHLDCYSVAKEIATRVRDLLLSRPGESFCYTCLAKHLTRDRQEVEKAAVALRVDLSIFLEPAVCSTCDHPRVTVQTGPAS